MPAITSPMRSWPLSFRYRFRPAWASSEPIVSVTGRKPQPLVLSVRRRTVAMVLLIGWVARRCTQPRKGLGGEV